MGTRGAMLQTDRMIGGREQDGGESNFPVLVHGKEAADRFLSIWRRRLRAGGHTVWFCVTVCCSVKV